MQSSDSKRGASQPRSSSFSSIIESVHLPDLGSDKASGSSSSSISYSVCSFRSEDSYYEETEPVYLPCLSQKEENQKKIYGNLATSVGDYG